MCNLSDRVRTFLLIVCRVRRYGSKYLNRDESTSKLVGWFMSSVDTKFEPLQSNTFLPFLDNIRPTFATLKINEDIIMNKDHHFLVRLQRIYRSPFGHKWKHASQIDNQLTFNRLAQWRRYLYVPQQSII